MADKLQIDGHGEYAPTDSDDDSSEHELIEDLGKAKLRGHRVAAKTDIMAFDDSDDEDDDDDDEALDNEEVAELMHDSDIEGADIDEDIPDSKDWGSKSHQYYNTDFVDPDYSAYNEQEEEMAQQEEEEAKIIQQRMAKQMKEEDFLFDDALKTVSNEYAAGKTDIDITDKSTKMKADFTGLSIREKQRLFKKDSPEFSGLVTDFQEYMKEVEYLLNPVLKYVKENDVHRIPALVFAQLVQDIMLTYCSNVTFYLLLKSKRVDVKNHPITKRLVQFKRLYLEVKEKYENIIKPQLEALLERINDGDKFEVLDVQHIYKEAAKKKKSKLGIMDQYDETKNTKQTDENDGEGTTSTENESGEEEEEETHDVDEEDARRGITYQMAKNKGLTPHRKKEQRNPRVRNRSKFRKALIRRKGAVRTVRKETQRYAGEISGIKSTVSKSIKFK